MRILWLHQYFATPKGWGAVRTYEFARRFCSKGHAVDVVCCAGYDASLACDGCGGGPQKVGEMRVFVSRAAYRPHMGFVRRLVSFLGFMWFALGHVIRHGKTYDVMIASSGPLTLAVPALVGRLLFRLPFVFEVIDVWPDSAIAAGVLKNPVTKWLSYRLEAWAYKYAETIVTCSTGMTERVEKKLGVWKGDSGEAKEDVGEAKPENPVATGQASKVTTLSNCCDLSQFLPNEESRRKTRERLGVTDDQIVVLYTGAMGLSNAVEDLVVAVKETQGDARVVWWFAGDGKKSAIIRECARTTAEPAETGERPTNRRVQWLGCLPKEDVVDLYLAADVNVVTFMHSPLFFENSPNKFFDGIAAGLPAVFNRTTWLAPWLERYGCGFICESEVPGRKMAETISHLAADPTRLRRSGQGARRLAEEVFSRDVLSEKYLAILESVSRG